MTVAEKIRERVEALPTEKQEEVLDFAEFLAVRCTKSRPLRSSRGLWAGLGIDISDKDIEEARREMWANFPREDLL